jgi:predicted ABC-type transport system involved in lysophospholipase L1 biosynthesis ATPase subunit
LVGLAHRLDHYPGQPPARGAGARAFVTEAGAAARRRADRQPDTTTGRHIVDLMFELPAAARPWC